jgi:hypothetical protein
MDIVQIAKEAAIYLVVGVVIGPLVYSLTRKGIKGLKGKFLGSADKLADLLENEQLKKEIRAKNPGVFFRFALVNMVMWGYFSAFICIAGLLFAGGIFGPKFVRSEEFPEIDTSIYLYDASFFGRAVSVKIKDPVFPYFSRELATLDDADPATMGITRDREWIRISPPVGKKILYNSSTGQSFREN